MNATSRHRMSEQAAGTAVAGACRMLRLPTIRTKFPALAEQAAREQMPYLAFLTELLPAERDDRVRRCFERRTKAAAFPRQKSPRVRLGCQPPTSTPPPSIPPGCGPSGPVPVSEATGQELEAVRKENQKLATERDILRRATKFSAAEMNW